MVVLACGIRTDTGAAYQLHAIDQLAVLAPGDQGRASRVGRRPRSTRSIRRAFQLARRAAPRPGGGGDPGQPATADPGGRPSRLRPGAGAGARARPRPRGGGGRACSARPRIPALYVGAGAAGRRRSLVRAGRAARRAGGHHLSRQGGVPRATTRCGCGTASAPRRRASCGGSWTAATACSRSAAASPRSPPAATGSQPPRRLIHVDVDPRVFNRNFPAALAVEADAAPFVDRAGPADRRRPPVAASSRRRSRDGHRTLRERWHRPVERRSGPPRCASSQPSSGTARSDAIFATDSGNGTFLAMEHLRLDAAGPLPRAGRLLVHGLRGAGGDRGLARQPGPRRGRAPRRRRPLDDRARAADRGGVRRPRRWSACCATASSARSRSSSGCPTTGLRVRRCPTTASRGWPWPPGAATSGR